MQSNYMPIKYFLAFIISHVRKMAADLVDVSHPKSEESCTYLALLCSEGQVLVLSPRSPLLWIQFPSQNQISIPSLVPLIPFSCL